MAARILQELNMSIKAGGGNCTTWKNLSNPAERFWRGFHTDPYRGISLKCRWKWMVVIGWRRRFYFIITFEVIKEKSKTPLERKQKAIVTMFKSHLITTYVFTSFCKSQLYFMDISELQYNCPWNSASVTILESLNSGMLNFNFNHPTKLLVSVGAKPSS